MSASGQTLTEHVRDHGTQICGIVPALAQRLPDLRPMSPTTPDAVRGRLAAAISRILQATAGARPTVIVFDDLHWADSPDDRALATWCSVRSVSRCCCISACPTAAKMKARGQSAGELFADLRREPGIIRIPLGGLAATDVAELLRMVADRPLDVRAGQFAAQLHRETAGNPFFVIEVIRHLTESGAFDTNADDWVLLSETPAIPEGIRDVVGRRLERLAPGTIDVLRCATVIGPLFHLDVLADVAQDPQESVLTFLEMARAARPRRRAARRGRRLEVHA